MQICQYCYSKNLEEDLNCYHCKAPLNIDRPILNESINIEKIDIFYVDYYQLKGLNSTELLYLLSYIRKERKNHFKEKVDFENQSKEYRILSKQNKLIENVLFDCFGRIPKMIVSNDLLRYKKMQVRSIKYHKSIIKKVKENAF